MHPEQPKPVDGKGPSIADLVISDMQERKRLGIERYGKALQPHNGRDAKIDLYQEILDAAMYVRQLIEECDDHRAEGVAEERAAVVAYLNALAERASCGDSRATYMNAAGEIELGKHRSGG